MILLVRDIGGEEFRIPGGGALATGSCAMDASTLLFRAGWFPGRRVDISYATDRLAQAGYVLSDSAISVLREFSGLTVTSADGDRSLWVDGVRAADDADPEWCRQYSDEAGTSLAPVGGYSHMTIFVDPDSGFWGGFDDDYGRLGDSVDEVVRVLLVDIGTVRLDRRLDVS